MKRSLRTRILLLIAGTTLLFAGSVYCTLAFLTGRAVEARVRQDVASNGAVFHNLIQDRVETLTNQCQLLASLPVVRASVQSHDPSTISDSSHDWQQMLQVDGVMFTGSDGRVYATSGWLARPDAGQADPGFASTQAGNVWSGIRERRGLPVLTVSIPVLVGSTVVGSLSASRPIDSRLAEDLKSDLGDDILFVIHGRIAGESTPLQYLPSLPRTPSILHIDGHPYVALYAPLPDSYPSRDMGFVTLRDYGQAAAPYSRLVKAFAVVFVLALLLALLAGGMVARDIIRPLDGVVAAAEVMRDGGWPDRLAVTTRDEIGLLQSAFNAMTDAVRDSQEKLLSLLDVDPLTGLTNHRRFQERVREEAQRCAASGERLTLVWLNIDQFREYNNVQGLHAGDDALALVASILHERQPELAVLARIGGDEFAVLAPRRTLAEAIELAELLRTDVERRSRTLPGGPITVSAGIAEFGTHSAQADGLLLAAELALSRAKSLGRNRACGFDSVPGSDETADPYQLYRFLKDESLATIQALAAAVDAKDPYTRGHSLSVAEYAAALARHLGLGPADVELIHTTGTLHDVGKIGVPDEILQKPGRLTDEQRTIMETHPVLGEKIVLKVPSLAGIVPGVKHHHERWDGRGYPACLAGDQIPRIARILAVADCYDAMTSDRPYRKGMPVDVALAEIERGAGTQFDPDLATAFVGMMRSRQLVAA
ncbi:MAG: HD domain-containing phosphohydrolase [Capsulimonadaceae bacterium]